MNIDEMIAVLTAFKEGKEVEAKSITETQDWTIVVKPVWNFNNYEYRVKQEPKLVPFDYNDDLVGKIVKHKTDNDKKLIIKQDTDCIYHYGGYMNYDYLLENFTFLDDKPCGKYE